MYEIVNVQYTGTYNNGGTSIPAVLGEFRASSAADLPTQNVDCHIICGCDGLDIATGDRYIWNGTAWILQPSQNAFSNVYTKSEIDNMITAVYQTMMYYHTTQTSGDGTITFYAFAGVVKSLSIYGNGQQTGTPTPDNPVMPEFCGTLDGTDWKIPLTCAGQTVPVYLGQTQTVRRIKKLVLTGNETLSPYDYASTRGARVERVLDRNYKRAQGLSNIYPVVTQAGPIRCIWIGSGGGDNNLYFISILDVMGLETVNDFKAYLAAQYAAGHPVTIWYVLAEPETAIVNEPLAKIGDYADELHSEDAGVQIPTVQGENTLTVDTELPPSLIEISGGNMHE